MLVFACGLMVALVMAWNVDLGKFAQVQIDNTTEVEDMNSVEELLEGDGVAYIERGTGIKTRRRANTIWSRRPTRSSCGTICRKGAYKQVEECCKQRLDRFRGVSSFAWCLYSCLHSRAPSRFKALRSAMSPARGRFSRPSCRSRRSRSTSTMSTQPHIAR